MWFGKVKLPIKWRLTLLSTFGLLLILIILHIFILLSLDNWITDIRQNTIRKKMSTIQQFYQLEIKSASSLQPWLQSYIADGEAIRIIERGKISVQVNKGIPEKVLLPLSGKSIEKVLVFDHQKYSILSILLPSGKGKIELYQDHSHTHEYLKPVFFILIWGSLIILCLVIIGGYFMSSIAFRPILKITQEVREFNPAHLGHRLEIPDTGDEIAKLSLVINGLLDRIYESIQKQRRFVSDASHELRTPIAVIRGYLDLLRRWGLRNQEVTKESLETMDQELKRIETMTHQLLQLARLEKEEEREPLEKVTNETFSLNEVLMSRIQRWRRVIRDVQIYDEIPEDHLLVIGLKADWEELLDILLDNAGKYTGKGGEILVTLHSKKNKVYISVTDTGRGIPAEDIPHVFERFYRAKLSRSAKKAGSGLGLSIAQRIVKKYDGELTIKSRLGEGTRISAVFDIRKIGN